MKTKTSQANTLPQLEPQTRPAASQTRRILRHLLRKRSAQIGGVIFLTLIFMALFGPLVIPYDPFDIHVEQRLQPPSLQHIFGTDEQGRDLFSRIIFGARYALQIMLITTVIGAAGGLLLGLPSAYFGGAADMLVMRLMDVMLGFPYILLILAIVAIIGPSLENAMIAIGVAGIPSFARLARSAILVVKEQDFVTAERALGGGNTRIMFRTVLPNILSPIIVYISLTMPTAVLAAAALSFVGLGAQPPMPEWGAMLVNARDFMVTAPWVVLAPGLTIFVVTLGINLFGNALRDVLDPRDTTSQKS
ncbi:MAG: ABC transporter permease [Chloroflexi bacterium]|nr:ABC transporter permease [Chloroflexota bacterium]